MHICMYIPRLEQTMISLSLDIRRQVRGGSRIWRVWLNCVPLCQCLYVWVIFESPHGMTIGNLQYRLLYRLPEQVWRTWSCMVLHGPAWSCMVLHGPAWFCMVLHGPAWSCMVLHGPAWSCMVLHGPAWMAMFQRERGLYTLITKIFDDV